MLRTPRRRTRDDPEVRRAQIIDQAIRIVGERGYYGFTIQELAQRCGLSNAGLLYHFWSKDQLFIAVVRELERREIQALAPLVAAAERRDARSDTAASFVDLLRTMLARAATRPELGRFHAVLQSESLEKTHPAHAPSRVREAQVLALFAKLLAPHVAKPHSTARQLLALMQGLGLQWLREDQAFDVVAEWDRAIKTVVPELFPARKKHGRSSSAARSTRRGHRKFESMRRKS